MFMRTLVERPVITQPLAAIAEDDGGLSSDSYIASLANQVNNIFQVSIDF